MGNKKDGGKRSPGYTPGVPRRRAMGVLRKSMVRLLRDGGLGVIWRDGGDNGAPRYLRESIGRGEE